MNVQDIDPRAKLLVVMGMSLIGPTLTHIWIVAMVFAMELGIARLAAIAGSARTVGRFLGWWCGSFVLVIAVIWVVAGTQTGVTFAFDILRFSVFFAAGLLFTVTTPPDRLYDALVRWRLPATLLIPTTIGMRGISLMATEVEGTVQALKLRGISIARVARSPRLALQGLVVPLLARTMKTADEVAAAATLRGFSIGMKRLSIYTPGWRWADTCVLLVSVFVLSGLVVLDRGIL